MMNQITSFPNPKLRWLPFDKNKHCRIMLIQRRSDPCLIAV
jgi:hypothetical protein